MTVVAEPVAIFRILARRLGEDEGLDERVDASRLRDGLARLSKRYPVVASRAGKDPKQKKIHWRFQPGGECDFTESTLDEADQASAAITITGWHWLLILEPIFWKV